MTEIFTFQGYYDTMDSGFRDKQGYVAVMSRTDDVINVAGHRLSTGSLEEVCFIIPRNPLHPIRT